MKNIFYLAGGLLLLSGALHLAKLLAYPIDPDSTLIAVFLGIFGAAYLIIGYFLIRHRDSAVKWAVIVPVIELLLRLLNPLENTDGFSIAYIVINVLVVVMVGYLLVAGQGKLGRVR